MSEQEDTQLDKAGLAELTKKRLVYAIPAMEQIPVQKNVTYKTADGAELQMDVYHPIDLQEGSLRPAVIFVHGDAPPEFLKDAKDWGVFVSYGQLAAASGFIAITFNHRSTEGFTKVYEVASDIDDLINYVRTHAEVLHIDKDSICIWAFSAGGPFGLRTAMREAPGFVRCIVSYYGFTDLKAHYDAFMEPSDRPQQSSPILSNEDLEEFSATYHLKARPKEIAPIFIARAGLDYSALNQSVDQFVREALAHNISIDLMNHPEGQHSFDMLDDNARSREIIRATLEFIKAHLLRETT